MTNMAYGYMIINVTDLIWICGVLKTPSDKLGQKLHLGPILDNIYPKGIL